MPRLPRPDRPTSRSFWRGCGPPRPPPRPFRTRREARRDWRISSPSPCRRRPSPGRSPRTRLRANGLRAALASDRGGGGLRRLPVARLRRQDDGEAVARRQRRTRTSSWSSLGEGMHDSRYAHWIELYDTVDEEERTCVDGGARGGRPTCRWSPSCSRCTTRPRSSCARRSTRSGRSCTRTGSCASRTTARPNPTWPRCSRSTPPSISAFWSHRRDANGHISASSNSAIALASGTWLCLMDHDDVLAEHALATAMLAVIENPGRRHLLQRRRSSRGRTG